VVFIFQLPAIIGTRIILPPAKDKIINRTIPMYHRKQQKEKLREYGQLIVPGLLFC
jgi:hypothetical protein